MSRRKNRNGQQQPVSVVAARDLPATKDKDKISMASEQPHSQAGADNLEQTVKGRGDATKPTHDEYKDLSDNVRHYNTHFLALLTILLAVTAGLSRIFFGEERGLTDIDKILVVIVGLIVTTSFWTQGEIYLYRQRVFERRLTELEPHLGYRQYSALSENKPYRYLKHLRFGRWAWRIFFGAVLLLWVYVLTRNNWYLLSVLYSPLK